MQARESVGTPFQFLAAVSGPTNDALEFHRALDVVAAHARGPLGAERVRQRRPSSNHVEIEGALAPVAELLTLWGRGEAIDIPPVPELGPVISRSGCFCYPGPSSSHSAPSASDWQSPPCAFGERSST